MAGGLVRRLFRASPGADPELREALAELDRALPERSSLNGPIALLKDILLVLYAEPCTDRPPSIEPEQAAAKLMGGVPLLRGESVQFDDRAFRRRWLGLCKVMRAQQAKDTAQSAAKALRRGILQPRELVQELLAGRPEAIHARAATLDLDTGLTAALVRFTAFPLLGAWSAALGPLREEAAWKQGYCPTCGSWPVLGELQGLEQKRFLRCGLCAAQWEFPLLLCPFCRTSDHRLLGFFHVAGRESKERAQTCDACHSYVKTVATLGALSSARLLAADVLSVHLDLAAAERGYAHPPDQEPLAW